MMHVFAASLGHVSVVGEAVARSRSRRSSSMVLVGAKCARGGVAFRGALSPQGLSLNTPQFRKASELPTVRERRSRESGSG
jgi:hypothetical protein